MQIRIWLIMESQQGQHILPSSIPPTERGIGVKIAADDMVFQSDRCLENMLRIEENQLPKKYAHFNAVQKEITSPMRQIVAEWMIEVCAEDGCQEEVALLAVSYMDRFLSAKSVRKTHLQILAAACLLLASKLREPNTHALSANSLIVYTDKSICKSELKKWEILVLTLLEWNLSTITPFDFLDLLLPKLPIGGDDVFKSKVRQHTKAFISLTAKEHEFHTYSSSLIAAASIAASLNGLKWQQRTGHDFRYLFDILTDLTSNGQDNLLECSLFLESLFEEHSRKLQPYIIISEEQRQHLDPQLHQHLRDRQHHSHHYKQYQHHGKLEVQQNAPRSYRKRTRQQHPLKQQHHFYNQQQKQQKLLGAWRDYQHINRRSGEGA